MNEPPPTPELCGSTRPNIACTATAASMALPPLRRISAPASTAIGLAATTAAVCFVTDGVAGGLAVGGVVPTKGIEKKKNSRHRKTPGQSEKKTAGCVETYGHHPR